MRRNERRVPAPERGSSRIRRENIGIASGSFAAVTSSSGLEFLGGEAFVGLSSTLAVALMLAVSATVIAT
jgi:hypothetical protein